jgi:hypothetical protein
VLNFRTIYRNRKLTECLEKGRSLRGVRYPASLGNGDDVCDLERPDRGRRDRIAADKPIKH